MGWSSGTDIMQALMNVLNVENVSLELRKKIYIQMIDALTDQDWDTVEECLGEDDAFDNAYDEIFES